MRIKKISSNKVEVVLTDKDLEYFDLDFSIHPPQAADLHNFLFEVMELVKTETGFDPYNGGQVVVEAAMDKCGMSLFISKLKDVKKRMSRVDFERVKRVRVKEKDALMTQEDIQHILDNGEMSLKKVQNKNTVFIFDSFSDFEKAVSVMPTTDFNDVSLYRRGRRYALIYPTQPSVYEYNILSEYSVHTRKNDCLSHSIQESWTQVATNSVLYTMVESLRKMNLL